MTNVMYFSNEFNRLKKSDFSHSPHLATERANVLDEEDFIVGCLNISHLFLSYNTDETNPLIKLFNLTIAKLLKSCVFDNEECRKNQYTLFLAICHKMIEQPTTTEIEFLFYNELVQQRKGLVDVLLKRLSQF